jgi:hypothetical protein
VNKMSASFNAGGTIDGTTITASVQFVGNGSGLTNLPAGSITLGSPNVPVITNGSSQLTTEATLAAVRGGTGSNSSAATGIAHVTAGAWTYSGIASADLAIGFSVTNAQTTATSANTASTIVARDGSGNFAAGAVTTTSLVQNASNVSPTGVATTRVANVQTTNATPTAILSITTTNNSVYAAIVTLALFDTTDASNNTGVISYLLKAATNGSGTVTIATLANYTTILDANVSTVSATATTSGANNLTLNVVGVVAKNINWMIRTTTLTQS